VLGFLLGMTIAYLYNRYTTRIYPISTSIIIRESEERADAKFLYNNPLVAPYRNYFNELYIIRSYPLITKVIEELNFHVSIQKEGDIKVTEQYNSLPISLKLIEKRSAAALRLVYLGDNKFQCSDREDKNKSIFSAGDIVNCNGVSFQLQAHGDLRAMANNHYVVQFKNPEDVAGNYIGRLRISWAEQGSSVVNLGINGAIPQKEVDFLSGLIKQYQEYDLNKKNLAASRSLAFIDEQLENIGDTLRMFETALSNFKQQNFITDLSSEAQELYEQLKTLESQRSSIVFAVNYYKYIDEYLKSKAGVDQVVLPSTIGVNDPVLNQLVQQLTTLQTELNNLMAFGDKNPMVVDKANAVNKSLSELKMQISEAIKSVRATDKIKVAGINDQITLIEKKLQNLPIAERTLVNIKRNYTLNENLYIFLQQKRAEAGISRASTTSDILIVNPPSVSGPAITPLISQNYLMYGTAGILIPLLIFTALEVFNNKIQSKEDIERITSIPFIGAIGHNNIKSTLIVYEKPKSAMAESFRALRSNLNYFTEGKDNKVFMVTSSLSGEGKSFTTINLATVFSLAGKRTLIIGADLRKPKLFDDFGLNNEKGLSVYLSGLVPLQEIIQHTSMPNLDVISGGPVPPNPSELLLNPRMDELIAQLKKSYDFILMDTPPLALITDGLVLTKYADHTVYIVRQNYTPRTALQAANEIYVSGKIPNLSIILNDVFRIGPGYGYGYTYGYGYAYAYGYPGKGYTDNSGYYSDSK
jgi:capsular exopolysaccharide synthesis family protein